jgi:CDP-6-deoxy-D-xylo-4-hexulose-3-dehydrase
MITLAKSSFYSEDATKRKLARFIMSAKKLSMGSETSRFERYFAEAQGCRHAVFVNSGSSANLALLQALLNIGRLRSGSRIGVSAVTWATNVMPIIELGMTPVVIDCALDTLNVSPETLTPLLKDIDCLFLTNALGFADDLPRIVSLCKRAGVLLLEDNCESIGSRISETLLGNFGLASTFSFFVGHHLSTIEGGVIATDDGELYRALVMVRAHGWDRELPKREQRRLRNMFGVDDFFSRFTFYDLAYNIRPTDVQGFLGAEQLRYLPIIIEKRERNFLKLFPLINAHPDLMPLRVGHMQTVSNFAIPVVAKRKKEYEQLKKRFMKSRVEIRPIIAGNISKQPFFKKYVHGRKEYPNAEHIHKNGFYFPNNAELTDAELGTLASLLKV